MSKPNKEVIEAWERIRNLNFSSPSYDDEGKAIIQSAIEKATEGNELRRIADLLESIIDKQKGCLRMVDIDRANVYKTHLGKKLSDGR